VDVGPRPRRRYTVGDALEDWLAHGVDGLSERTVTLYRGTIVKALNEELGSVRLTELTASGVQGALASLASRLSTRTAQIAHNVLVRAIRHAERDDLVGRNVAALVDAPKGQLAGRPSKSLTLEQAVALMGAAKGTALEAYIVLSLLSGVRTEEARALHWDHVVAWVDGQWRPASEAGFDHEQVAVFVWRAERAGGDTKTPRSRRTLALPRKCVEALREQRVRQAKDRLSAGPFWKDHNLVFASAVGTPMDDHNVRRQFRVMILDEMLRALQKNHPDITEEKAARLRELINGAVRDCLVTGYQPLIEALELPDPDDRHVLAAAIKAGAQLIVTRNRKDFPVKVLAHWDIRPKSPDDFVRDVMDFDAQAVWACVQQIVDSRTKRPVTVDDVLGDLQRDGLVASAAASRSGPGAPPGA
jgi:integrase